MHFSDKENILFRRKIDTKILFDLLIFESYQEHIMTGKESYHVLYIKVPKTCKASVDPFKDFGNYYFNESTFEDYEIIV